MIGDWGIKVVYIFMCFLFARNPSVEGFSRYNYCQELNGRYLPKQLNQQTPHIIVFRVDISTD